MLLSKIPRNSETWVELWDPEMVTEDEVGGFDWKKMKKWGLHCLHSFTNSVNKLLRKLLN